MVLMLLVLFLCRSISKAIDDIKCRFCVLLLSFKCCECTDYEEIATTAVAWEESIFFELIEPEEIAYVYKVKPAKNFGVKLVCEFSLLCFLLLQMTGCEISFDC
jgi:hypothetical protein